MTELERVQMTLGCRDTEAIPKVDGAGAVMVQEEVRIQLMHNGVKVVADGYCGVWMTQIIEGLKGHHEPQQELVFHALLRHVSPATRIVELGAWWAYYACWYLREVPDSTALCIEPCLDHLRVGEHNAVLNGVSGRVAFKNAWIGREQDGQVLAHSVNGLPCLDMDAILESAGGPIEMLHVDIQGAEIGLIESMGDAVSKGAIRFLVVSTHHESISGAAFTHDDCIRAIRRLGGVLLAEHSVEESYSGDGLIVASFLPDDLGIELPKPSKNAPEKSLFPPKVIPLISYAQNYEDIMLWRALKQVAGGFYVDVGADDPREYSVTKLFYDRGWCGINIEPVVRQHAKFERERTRDINLQMLAGATTGTAAFWEVVGTGLSTMDEAFARCHAATGRWEIKNHFLPVPTVDQICLEHAIRDIHFMKVDVEGAEKQVLEGMALKQYRPWIILLESTEPMSPTPNHHLWESLLLMRDYDFVYGDGLNRFYVAKEHSELKSAFRYPPNVFDRFITAKEGDAVCRHGEAQAQQRATQAQLQDTQAQQRATQAQLQDAQAQQQATQAQLQDTQAQQRATQAQLQDTQAQQLATQAQLQDTQAQQLATQAREALWQAQLAHSNEVQVALMSQLEQANQREISRKTEILRLRAIQKSLSDRLEKGPLHLRQLVRQPKEFFREISAYDRKQRHPRKAVGYLLRKLRKMKRFVMRQPGKSLKGGGSTQNRQIAKNNEQNGLNLSKESADPNCVNSGAGKNGLSPRAQRIYGLIERKIKQ
jgi:FkbM family methyltransferase